MQYILVANEKAYRDNSWGCTVKKILILLFISSLFNNYAMIMKAEKKFYFVFQSV